MNKTIAAAAQLCFLIGLGLTVFGLLAAKPVLTLLNTPVDIRTDAAAYLSTMVCGTLIVMGYNMSASILRALGNGKTPLIAMAVAALMNIGLDCLFVFVFRWGIIGAALASLTAQLVSFLYCLFAIFKIDCIHLDREAWRLDPAIFRKMIVFGIPIAIQYIIITFGGMILQSGVNLQGSTFIAGYTATNKLYSFLQCFAMSLGQASCTYVSQNYGAGLGYRVRKGVADSVKIVLVMSVCITVITLLTRWQILQVFLDTNAPGGQEALGIAVRYVTIMVFCFPVLHILHIFRNVLQAMGIAFWSLVSGAAEMAARVLMAKVMLGHMGVDALFLAEPASWFGAMLCVLLPYFYYRRKLPGIRDTRIT